MPIQKRSSPTHKNQVRNFSVSNSVGIFMLLLLFSTIMIGFSIIQPSPIIDIICIFGYLFLVFWVFVASKLSFVLLLPMIMYKTSSFVSLSVISFGFKIPEIGRVGQPTISSSSYLLVTAIFFGIVVTTVELLRRGWLRASGEKFYQGLSNIKCDAPQYYFIFTLIVVQALILASYGLLNGFPLLLGTDRFLYRMLSGNVLYVFVLNFKLVTSLLFGYVVASSNIRNNKSIFISISYACLVILYVLYGEKFNQLLLITFVSFIPILLVNGAQIKRLFIRFMPIAAIVLFVAFCLVYFIYSDYGKMSFASTSEKIFGRMAQQSQLWYVVNLNGFKFFSFDYEYFINIIKASSMFGADEFFYQEKMGSFYFLFNYSPSDIQSAVVQMKGAVQFTQVSEALFLDVFGVCGLGIYLVGAGVLFATFMAYVSRLVLNGKVVALGLCGIYMSGVLAMLNQGAIHQAIGLGVTRYLLIAIALDLGYGLVLKPRRTY